jgi:glycosyltransferase involved in cell wall biosynthesis
VRIVLDYRPALRARTGVGELVHELGRHLATDDIDGTDRVQVVLFTSSWKDRPSPAVFRDIPNAEIVDRRIPVRALTWAWNRAEWPPIESLVGRCDVVHALTPLLIPAKWAAQVVTVHDLDFLRHPDRVEAEMRRDFPSLVAAHVARAHHIVVPSRYVAGEVERHFGASPERVSVCSPGPPAWAPAVLAKRKQRSGSRHILFVGTLEPRKNVGTLLEAYRALLGARPDAPPLVIVGRMSAHGLEWQRTARETGLGGKVIFRGYVDDEERPALFADARMLVLPSLEEGFGFPVLEAMACGVPVVISNRGSLPELAGDAAEPVPPDDIAGLRARMEALLDDNHAESAAARGLGQASRFSWAACGRAARRAYRTAIDARDTRYAHRG